MASHRVLIVEDDMSTLYALRALFERRGWSVSAARTVAEAVAALEATPDWVVLDLYLPDGEGEELLRRVREAGLPTRVAIASGVLDPARLEGLRRWQPDLVMTKPIDFVRLFSACLGIKSAPATPGAGAGRFEPMGYLESIRTRDGQALMTSAG